VILNVTQPLSFIKYYQAWEYKVWIWKAFKLSFLVLVFYCLRRLWLLLSLVIFFHFPSRTMPLELLPLYKFWYFFFTRNLSISNPLVCLDYNPKFSPPFGCVDPTHVASSSCVVPAHLALSNYVDPSVVTSSIIVPNPKGEKPSCWWCCRAFHPSLLIQYQKNKIMITLGNFKIRGLLSYLG
jgi:hypothetical protein